MFGLFDDVVKVAASITADVVGTVVEVGSLGNIEINRKNISTLIEAGYTIYELSEMTGIAVNVLEEIVE
jgi:hypothetical protein